MTDRDDLKRRLARQADRFARGAGGHSGSIEYAWLSDDDPRAALMTPDLLREAAARIAELEGRVGDAGPHLPTPCCLCGHEAVAIYYMPRGCVARPDLTVQPLCAHHEAKRTPIGGECEMIKDLRVSADRPGGEVEP